MRHSQFPLLQYGQKRKRASLPLPRRGEEFFAVSKTVGLEKKAEQYCAVGRYRLWGNRAKPLRTADQAAIAF
jgi:hypothetical protein